MLPVYKSLSTWNSPITLCSLNDAGTPNRLGNFSFVEVSFAQSGSHTLTMTSIAASRGTLPMFSWGDVIPQGERQWTSEPRSQTSTRNFRAGEPLVLQAADFRNIDNDPSNDDDSCFTFSVVKNP